MDVIRGPGNSVTVTDQSGRSVRIEEENEALVLTVLSGTVDAILDVHTRELSDCHAPADVHQLFIL